jgi:membrane protease YdiL (CAAX protease family)
MKRVALRHGAPALGARAWAAAGAALALVLLGTVAASAGVSLPRVGVLLVLAPLAEEVIFRAGLHETLLRHGAPRGGAVVLTAIVFGVVHALLHADPMALAVALPALLIGGVYQRTRRVWPCAVLHAAMNAVWLAWGLAA